MFYINYSLLYSSNNLKILFNNSSRSLKIYYLVVKNYYKKLNFKNIFLF